MRLDDMLDRCQRLEERAAALYRSYAASTRAEPSACALWTELAREEEEHARGPYAGAVGYLTFSGDLDFCITIRTAVVSDGEAHVQAGAGVVADSDPERELRETEAKASALLQAVAR